MDLIGIKAYGRHCKFLTENLIVRGFTLLYKAKVIVLNHWI